MEQLKEFKENRDEADLIIDPLIEFLLTPVNKKFH